MSGHDFSWHERQQDQHRQAQLRNADAAVRQIAELSRSARSAWLVLIGLLLFASVTLLSVTDADFFAFGARTDLPLVGVAIPTERFFLAVPLAILAVFAYLHVSLAKLWRALADAPGLVDGRPLRDAVTPWFFSDLALQWRADQADSRRAPFAALVRFAALFFGWVAAPMLLFWLWVRSWPAHQEWMSAALGIGFALGALMAWRSWRLAKRILRDQAVEPTWRDGVVRSATAVGAALATVAISDIRTEQRLLDLVWTTPPAEQLGDDGQPGDFLKRIFVAHAQLAGAELAERPADWIGHSLARIAFRGEWAERERAIRGDGVAFAPSWIIDADQEFEERRRGTLEGLRGRSFREADLRLAELSETFIAGLDFRGADLTGARLDGAVAEGAAFNEARLQFAVFDDAAAELAVFENAYLQHAGFLNAKLDGANLSFARLDGAAIGLSSLVGADFRGASMRRMRVRRSDLRDANLVGADLTGAQITQAELDVAFGDASTDLPEGLTRPGHWPNQRLASLEVDAAWDAWRRMSPPERRRLLAGGQGAGPNDE